MRLCLCIAALLCAAAPAAWSREARWESWRGLPVVAVAIEAGEVFDTTRPEENHWPFRWVNALHIRTREGVIRRELLCSQGSAFDPLLVEESERNLRALGIFQDVRIEAEAVEGGVRLLVHTEDRWSMRVLADVAKEGDIYRVRLGLENINFLGRGSVFGGNVVASNDVDAVQLFAGERRLFGSRWNAAYGYGSDDLVVANEATLVRPYFSELVHWTADLRFRSIHGDRRFFFDGALADTLDLDESIAEGFGAGHAHGEVRTRLGLLYSRRDVSRVLDAHQAAVGLCWGAMQRRFRQVRNVDRYGTSEDIASGWSVQAGAGADLRALGADDDRPLWRLDATYARFLGDRGLLGVQFRHHSFYDAGEIENGRVELDLYGFQQWPPRQSLAWNLGAAALLREPEYLRFAIGGDNQVRGYPARFDTGTRLCYAHLEHRVFTPVRFLFLGFGAAVFVDAAQAWEIDEPFRLAGTHLGGGAGLRIGNPKSGASVFRLDFAFGRDSFEVSVASGSFFRAARSFEFPEPSLYR